MACLTLRDLSFTYPDNKTKSPDSVSLTLKSGELMTVIGPTGSGKSTLLRLLKPELRQNGVIEGSVTLGDRDITSLSPAESARRIAYVAQSPEEQIVTDRVWHELAFSLESLGEKQSVIARRVAEAASYFGISEWYRRPTAELSGGQKQLLNLAAAMTTDPELLILDEPTAQLDPVSASRFIEAVRKLNRETGLSVIITEHRAEELIPMSDKLLILDSGKAVCFDTPEAIAKKLSADSRYLRYMPCAARVFAVTGGKGECPLSAREGRRFIEDNFSNKITKLGSQVREIKTEPALQLSDIRFSYGRKEPDVLSGLDLTVNKSEIFALLGPNGAGKSTAIAVAAGLKKPYLGKIRLFGRPLSDYKGGSLYDGNISLLPQDAESVFISYTVGEELKGCEKAKSRLPFDLTPLNDRHPYDISGGERQLVALCKALSTDPKLLLLDEPTKGLDPDSKLKLAEAIMSIRDSGVTVLMVSHDVEFAAMCADRCALLFDGAVTACESTADFMSGNRFYTTPASRMTRGVYDDAYTAERAAELIGLNGRRA